MRAKRLPKSIAKVLRTSLCAIVAFSAIPAPALAVAAEVPSGTAMASQEGAAATVVSGSWTLSYHQTEKGVCIDGVTAEGTSALEIPSTVGGRPVVALGENAFRGVVALKEITLPSTLQTMGDAVFLGSGLERLRIPASVSYLPWQCFRGCTALTDVTFEGATMKYILNQAFYGCTSLTEVQLPRLTAYPTEAETGVNASFLTQTTIGADCFNGCTKLKRVVFSGPVAAKELTYLASNNCFAGCTALTDVVCLGQAVTFPMGTGQAQLPTQNVYYTLDFYGSEKDADEGRNLLGSATYQAMTGGKTGTRTYSIGLLDLLSNPSAYAKYRYGTADAVVPSCPAGKVWGIADHGVSSTTSKMSDSYRVVAVDKDNVGYGWLSSPRIDAAYRDRVVAPGYSAMSTETLTFYADGAGDVAELGRIAVCAADGSILDASKYTLVYEQETTIDRKTSYKTVEPSQIKQGGTYRVTARGTGAYASEETASVTFTVAAYAPEVTDCTDASQSRRLGRLMASAVEGSEAEFSVVTSAAHWSDQLVGAGLAGVGQGALLCDCGSDCSGEMTRAFIQAGASALQTIGSTSHVPQSVRASSEACLMDYLRERNLGKASRYSSDSTAQALSDEVYSTIKKGRWGANWGDTAIVVPTKQPSNVLTVAQIAYERKAPVFFADGKGTLSATDLGYLKSGRFKNVLIAGTAQQVSASCAESIKSATGVTPERVLASGTNGTLNSIEGAREALASGASVAQVVIADGRNAADATAASVLAARMGGIVLTCASSADAKQVQAYLQSILKEKGSTAIEHVYFVGNFASWGSDVRARVLSLWRTPKNTVVGVGDTLEISGLVYKITGTSTLQVVGASNAMDTSLTINTAVHDGNAYRVTGVAASALAGSGVTNLTLGPNVSSVSAGFAKGLSSLRTITVQNAGIKTIAASQYAGLSRLVSVSYAGKVSSIGAGAFQGCVALANLNANVRSASAIGKKAFYGCAKLADATFASVKKIDASAFQNCTALKTTNLGSKLTSVGVSAFQGCTKLTTVKIPSKALKTIGSKAFYGCKKLKTLSLGTSKLTAKRVGSKAFAKTQAKMTVKAPKAKVAAYKKAFVAKGLSKKATIKKG